MVLQSILDSYNIDDESDKFSASLSSDCEKHNIPEIESGDPIVIDNLD